MTIEVKQVHIKILAFLVFLMVVVTIGTLTIVQRNSHNVDTLDKSVASMDRSVKSVKRSTDHLESFVRDLETESPQERARSAAITQAVQQVPQIREILCQAFPEVPACKSP